MPQKMFTRLAISMIPVIVFAALDILRSCMRLYSTLSWRRVKVRGASSN